VRALRQARAGRRAPEGFGRRRELPPGACACGRRARCRLRVGRSYPDVVRHERDAHQRGPGPDGRRAEDAALSPAAGRIPAEWAAALADLESAPVVLVIGPTEAGKTTFTAWLASTLYANGLRVAIVDADVG